MESLNEIQLAIYQGPLDLLLDLIRKQEINIYDIPIAQITGQYLEYVHRNLERLDTEAAGEFLVMAATLIHIKSKMLLPPDPTAVGEEAEDPRAELVHQLLEHEKFRKAAQMLQQKQMLQGAVWSAPGLSEFLDPSAEQELAVSLIDLVQAFQKVLERMKDRPLMEITEDRVSVAEMMQRLCDVLAASPKPVLLSEVLANVRSREAVLAIFLATLELIRLQALAIRQSELFGAIELRKGPNFAEALASMDRTASEEYR